MAALAADVSPVLSSVTPLFRDRLSSLPIDCLALTFCFVSSDADALSEVVNAVIGTPDTEESLEAGSASDASASASASSAHRFREDVYRSLCRERWRSVREGKDANWIPDLPTWEAKHRALSRWVPREGFYSVLDAAPWGLLVRMRFDGGSFVGDLLFPKSGALGEAGSMFGCAKILVVDFGNDGAESRVWLCHDDISDGVSVTSFDSQDREVFFDTLGALAGSVTASQVSDFSRALRLIGDAQQMGDERTIFSEAWSAWHPRKYNEPTTKLVQSLWHLNNQQDENNQPSLTLDWVDGPSRQPSFQFVEGMPLIRPGLYSGVYPEEHYGKFSREIILVEYRQYNLIDGDNDTVWERVRSEIFNVPEQENVETFFEKVKDLVEELKCENVTFVVGRKVTGDFHVPMQKISFGALVHPKPQEAATLPLNIRDRGGGTADYSVVNSWAGWGTLAFPGYASPTWSKGVLVQVCALESENQSQKFGFVWGNEPDTSILSWMQEQEEYPWFASA